ncbi:MAG: AlpA family phage regulatory protein [Methylophaga sp.]|nr:AlpA family phage regulatory protein [Methylophaga sp.]
MGSTIIIRLNDVKKMTGLSRSSIYDLISKGLFPKQIKLTPRSSGWVLSEIQQWLDDRIAARDAEMVAA